MSQRNRQAASLKSQLITLSRSVGPLSRLPVLRWRGRWRRPGPDRLKACPSSSHLHRRPHLPGATVGYSIGRWLDGDRRYDTLEVGTRGIIRTRVYDSDGAPFHPDNATVVKERVSLDQDDRNILRNEITTIDNALTRPWTVTRSYQRDRDSQSREYVCAVSSQHVVIEHEDYLIS
jgi:hypothetical protein